jgi:hypothetical protein
VTVSKLSLLRFWLEEHSALMGLVLAVCIGVPLLALVVPVAPSEQLQGTVLSFGLNETDSGSYPIAVVSVAKGTVPVRISRQNRCRIGGRIHLLKQHHVWGPLYASAVIPCD